MTKAKETCREWLDTLVVAISVAMCFRAYFFEPFNIPTGSMQWLAPSILILEV